MSEPGESEANEEELPESPEVMQDNLFEVRDKELKAGGKVSALCVIHTPNARYS